MKITSQKFQQDIQGLPTGPCWSCLLYGPNGGLINIITNEAAQAFNGKSPNIIKMYGADIEKNPSDFYNSILNLSLFAEYQIIVVKDVSNKFMANLSELKSLADSSGTNIKSQAFIIITASNLDTKSKLRLYYEKEANLLSVPCYEDDKNATIATIKDFLTKNGMKYSAEQASGIASYCGGDRASVINDLSVFLLYLGEQKEFTDNDIKKVFYDSQTAAIDELTDALFDGSTAKAHALFENIIDSDGQIITIVRIVISHLKSIRSMKEETLSGKSADEVIKQSRVFFKRIGSYKKHLSIPLGLIDSLLYKLALLEIKVKKESKYNEMCIAIMSQAITSICSSINSAKK